MRNYSIRRLAAAALGLGAIAAAAGAAAFIDQRPAAALTNCAVADLSIDAEESAFLGLINQYRAQNGLGALTVSSNLNRAASWMVVDLATKNYFSHTDSLGRSPSTRAVECGYPSGAGENLAAGTVRDTAQEAFDAWKASAGHNANMLTSYYQQIGIARYYSGSSTYGWYWATDFGTVNDGTSGGGTAPPPPPPVTVAKAEISSPANGSTLPGSSATFNWTAGSGALEYFLYAGTSPGANNLYGQPQGLALARSVANLPTNGSTVYVRLWTRLASGWTYNDYSYRAATITAPPPVTSAKAALISPAPGSVIPAFRPAFSWTAASGGLEYFLYVGTSQGANNLYGQPQGLNTTVTLGQLPAASVAWVRLWTRTAAGWTFTDYAFAGIR